MLRRFCIATLESKEAALNYIASLRRLTDNSDSNCATVYYYLCRCARGEGLIASDDASESATMFVTADVTVTRPAKVAALKAFVTDHPFQAPLIVDLIHETWPSEVGLPDPMVCAAGAYAWASLSTWQTGHYVPTPEFSQELLESTYKALEDFIKQQQEGKSSKSFNKAMHDLYLRVSRSQSAPVTSSGSANNVITLAIDSD
ncbi:hypothetical protein B0H13DRAFT_2350839 [Mycena leptocephala]|nr:hypothetical protein B0H13DRAFT_2350839 [Mycena leptocephala]